MLRNPIIQLSERSLNHENSLFNQRGYSAKGPTALAEPCSPQARDPQPPTPSSPQDIPGRIFLKPQPGSLSAVWRNEPHLAKVLPDPEYLERLLADRKRDYMMYWAQMTALSSGSMSPMSSYSSIGRQPSEQTVQFFDQPSSLPGLSASPMATAGHSQSPQSPLASMVNAQPYFATPAPTADNSPSKNTSFTKVYHEGRPRACRIPVEPEFNPQEHPFIVVRIDNEDRIVAIGEDRLKAGDLVIVGTDRGYDIGKVISEAPANSPSKSGNAQEKILRLATAEDLQTQEELRHEANEAVQLIRPIAQKHLGNELTVVAVHIRLDREKFTVKYRSAHRVDFRALCRSLNQIYHCRIWFHREEEAAQVADA